MGPWWLWLDITLKHNHGILMSNQHRRTRQICLCDHARTLWMSEKIWEKLVVIFHVQDMNSLWCWAFPTVWDLGKGPAFLCLENHKGHVLTTPASFKAMLGYMTSAQPDSFKALHGDVGKLRHSGSRETTLGWVVMATAAGGTSSSKSRGDGSLAVLSVWWGW